MLEPSIGHVTFHCGGGRIDSAALQVLTTLAYEPRYAILRRACVLLECFDNLSYCFHISNVSDATYTSTQWAAGHRVSEAH